MLYKKKESNQNFSNQENLPPLNKVAFKKNNSVTHYTHTYFKFLADPNKIATLSVAILLHV